MNVEIMLLLEVEDLELYKWLVAGYEVSYR